MAQNQRKRVSRNWKKIYDVGTVAGLIISALLLLQIGYQYGVIHVLKTAKVHVSGQLIRIDIDNHSFVHIADSVEYP